MNLKRFTIAIVSVLVVIVGVKLVYACAGGDDPYDYYPSFFQNNVTGDPAYRPFYYTAFLQYYDEPSFEGTPPDSESLPDANIPEWYAYCNKAATQADIDSFVYTYPLSTVTNIFDHLTNGNTANISPEEKNNSFTQWLLNKKNATVLEYLVYAKQCEPYTKGLESYFDDKAGAWVMPRRDSATMQDLLMLGMEKYGKVKDEFLSWRYAYQVLRMSFYSGNYTQAGQLFDKLIGSKTTPGIMYARCLGIKAGSLYKAGNKIDAAYWYSRIFDLSDEMKFKAYVSFNWAINGNIDEVLKLARSDHERAVLYVMDGLYENAAQEKEGLSVMQTAFRLDPNVKGLDVIMTRELNKAEERYQEKDLMTTRDIHGNAPWFDSYYVSDEDMKSWPAVKREYQSYLDKLNDFAQQMASDKRVLKKSFWNLASAYIYFMQNDETNCKKYLAQARQYTMSPAEQDVYDIVNTLYTVRKNGLITAQTEADLLPSLENIERRGAASSRFAKVYRDMMSAVISTAYLAQRDTVKALYCLARINKDENGKFTAFDDFTDIPGSLLENMSIERLHQVQAFINKTDKTDFERWLTQNAAYNASVLYELEGTKYIREQQFDKAVAVLKNVSADMLSKWSLPDVLVSHLLDSQDWNASDTANMYNKLQFAQKMAGLQRALQSNPKDGRAAYQYASGLYNMTYYGKAHHAFDYYRSGADEYAYFNFSERSKFPAPQQEYYSAIQPEKYYMQAFENSTDPEVKARCLFLAAKCWQKNCPVPIGKNNRYEVDDVEYYKNALKSPYLKQLTDNYRNTKFFTTAVNTCSYLKDYVKKNK